MLSENYKCDGQISLIDYMAELEEETKKCADCIYFKEFKCVRSDCHKIEAEKGWNALWYDKQGHVFGNWPTCDKWQAVQTVVENKEYYMICDAEAKDKTFKWPKDTWKKFDDVVIAWRYKETL